MKKVYLSLLVVIAVLGICVLASSVKVTGAGRELDTASFTARERAEFATKVAASSIQGSSDLFDALMEDVQNGISCDFTVASEIRFVASGSTGMPCYEILFVFTNEDNTKKSEYMAIVDANDFTCLSCAKCR